MKNILPAVVVLLVLQACGGDDSDGDIDAGADATVVPDTGTDGAVSLDAETTPDAGPFSLDASGPPDMTPVEAPSDAWTWVPVEQSACMDGSRTGFGINPMSPTKLVIYMEGGGACWNDWSCNFAVVHADGYDRGDALGAFALYGHTGVFDRNDEDNPTRDWSYAFFPYCSGDVFAGLTESGGLGRVQVGYHNVTQWLARLKATFPDLEQVLLTGSSAGGFGAFYNYDHVQQTFGEGVNVTLLDDSAPAFSDTYLAPCLQEHWRETWNMNATMPEDCEDCRNEDGGGIVNLAIYFANKYPTHNFGIISSTRDQVIRGFFGVGQTENCDDSGSLSGATYEMALSEMRDEIMAPYPNFHTYLIDSTRHVWIVGPLSSVSVDSVPLSSWISDELNGSESWGDVGPGAAE